MIGDENMDNNKLAKSGFDTREIPYVGQNPFYNDEHKKVCLDCDIEKIMNDMGIPLNVRGEALTLREFADLANAFDKVRS